MISIEDVRAYVHAHDDTNAAHIEWSLCRPDGWLALFCEGAWDYLCALYTPELRKQILDRKMLRMSTRLNSGHNQFVVDCVNPKRRGPLVLCLGIGTRDANWHHVYMTPQNRRAAKIWFDQEKASQTRALAPRQIAILITHSRCVDHMQIARDARRRIDERLDALGLALAYAQHPHGPLPGDMPRALITSLKLDCARHLFDLSIMPARQETQRQLTPEVK